jgi:hypothetical protein
MPFTKRISIERYKNADEVGSAGLIEGETEDGERWIIFMDTNGKPQVYWPRRDENGAVHGAPVPMAGPVGPSQRMAKLKEILASSVDPVQVVARLRAAVEAAEQRIAEEGAPERDQPIE